MIFSLFGLTVAAFVGLVLGLIAPRLVPVPPPATRGLVAMLYGSFVFAGSLVLAAMTREIWAPPRPTLAASAPMVAAAPPAEAEPPARPAPETRPQPPVSAPAPAAAPAPEPSPEASPELPPSPTPQSAPASPPIVDLPAPNPPPDPGPPPEGPPPEGPTRFGPKALGQSAAKLQKALTDQGLVTAWDAQTGPLGQAVQIGQGTALTLLSEGEEDRLYRVQLATDLGSALADLGPVARDTARLQLGLLGLALAAVSPEPERLRQASDQVWQEMLAALLAAPEQPRAARTLFVAGAALRLTLTQAGKASAQLAAEERDLDPLLDVQP